MCEYRTTFANLDLCGISTQKDSTVCIFHKEMIKYNYIPYGEMRVSQVSASNYPINTKRNRVIFKIAILQLCYSIILKISDLYSKKIFFAKKPPTDKPLSIDITNVKKTIKNIDTFLLDIKKYYLSVDFVKMLSATRLILHQIKGVLENSSILETKYGIQVYDYDNNALIYIYCNNVLASLYKHLSDINTENDAISELLDEIASFGRKNNIVLSKYKTIGKSVEFCSFCIPIMDTASCLPCPNFAIEDSFCNEHLTNKESETEESETEESETEEDVYEEEDLIPKKRNKNNDHEDD